MLLERSRSQLLVVDVQERFMSVVHEAQRMVDRCAILMQAAQKLDIPITITEQYRKGLGPTTARLNDIKGDAPTMEKAHFSCANDPKITERVRGMTSEGRSQVVVCGIESHVCVLQSALGFKSAGLDIFVVADAVSSRHPESIAVATDRMRDAGVGVINTEMAVFEWLHVAGTDEFKEVSKLIK